MLTWAWHGAVPLDRVSTQLTRVLASRGYTPTMQRERNFVVSLYEAGGGVLVVAHAVGGLAIAGELTRALAVGARFAEVDLRDTAVGATSHELTADGNADVGTNRDDEANELCQDWFEGKKYRSEAADDLAAMFVSLDDGCPDGGDILLFERSTTNARVYGLLDAIRGGATWERTTLDGRVAIKVKALDGARMSVLTADELATFEAGLVATPPPAAKTGPRMKPKPRPEPEPVPKPESKAKIAAKAKADAKAAKIAKAAKPPAALAPKTKAAPAAKPKRPA